MVYLPKFNQHFEPNVGIYIYMYTHHTWILWDMCTMYIVFMFSIRHDHLVPIGDEISREGKIVRFHQAIVV